MKENKKDTDLEPIVVNGCDLNKSAKRKSAKFYEIIVAIVICVVVILFFFSDLNFFSNDSDDTYSGSQTFQEYVLSLESKLEKTITNIEGVGKVSVAITFESGIEKNYAYEVIKETSNGYTTEELLLYKGEPIVLKEIMPEIKGVVVVAKGASNAVVRLNIVRTVQILLGVSYDKIEVFNYKD